MKYAVFLLFYIVSSVTWASIVDYGPPQDALGHWEFDLYDASGLQRGTASNPFYFSTSGGAPATSALQTTGNTALTAIQTNTLSTANSLSNLGIISTSALQTSGNNYLSQIATNTASALTDTISSGSISAANGAVTVMSQGAYTITASITGTFVATLIAEAQLADNTWVQVPIYNAPLATATAVVPSVTTPSSITIIGGGYLNVRIRALTYTSGIISVALDASIAQQSTLAAQLGVWSATPVDGSKASYSASVTATIPIAITPTDIFTITGSATKTIRITRIGFSGSQTTAGQRDVLLIKRSTADTGGTSTAVAAVPHDSANAAATASVLFYTANPTLGTAVGAIRSARLYFATVTTDSDNYFWDFGTRPTQAIVLRGSNQQLAVSLNSIAGVGNSVDINIEWSEE